MGDAHASLEPNFESIVIGETANFARVLESDPENGGQELEGDAHVLVELQILLEEHH